jgi:ribonuclease D
VSHPAEPAPTPDLGEPGPPELPLLREPADGVPEPITTSAALAELIARIADGTGPVALDAERASGYRYSQRAYLVQLRRTGAGTALIDPIALPDLAGLDAAIGDTEWILHAASQDLACLAEVGLRPRRLFDTELAGRVLGDERVALGTMVEQHLGVRLEKGHSAADWSTRPLPDSWLAYAALDVELLIPLRDLLHDALADSGKLEWAEQEFEAVRVTPPSPPRADPWRRTSGIHKVRSRRQLAIVRALWIARDTYAAERDNAPGRTLPDAAIVDAARAEPKTPAELAALPIFGGSRQRRQLSRWFAAIEQGRGVADADLPPIAVGSPDAMPPAARWRDRDPDAAARLVAVREAVTELATSRQVLAQNLLASDVVRRLAWEPPAPLTAASVSERLTALGARPWQVELVTDPIVAALTAP